MGAETQHSYRNDLDALYEELYKAGKVIKELHHSKGTNAGLWLDKYIKKQSQDDNEIRSCLVKEVSEIAIPDAYQQFYKRWQQGLADIGAKERFAKANGRMVIGLGDESVLETSIALHHTYGVPYIPGSALKGLAASYARQRLKKEDWGKGSPAYNVVFGDTNEAGCITFFDALLYINPQNTNPHKPDASVLYRDIITVHHPDYYQGKDDVVPSDWDSPTPIPFLSAKGEYLIALAAPDLYHGQTWINKTFAILRLALQELGIGAKTSSGYGRMDLQKIEEDDIIEVEEIVPEKPSIRLLQEIANASQVTYELFAAWEQLPAGDEGVEVARELVKRMDSAGGKKRSDKWETRYQQAKRYIVQHEGS